MWVFHRDNIMYKEFDYLYVFSHCNARSSFCPCSLPQIDIFWTEETDGLGGEVKEAIHVKQEWPSLNRGGGLLHLYSASCNTVLISFSRQFNPHSHLDSCDPMTDMLAGWVNDSHATVLKVLTTLLENKFQRLPLIYLELKKPG